MILCLGLMMFSFAACSSDKQPTEEPAAEEAASASAVVGKWEYETDSNIYYLFNEDGTGAYGFGGSEMVFTYEDDGAALSIQYENSTEPNVFEYKIEDKNLLIQDSFGEFVTYVKK